MVWTLARDLHLSEDHILWHLPLARAHQYMHVALRSAGAWTIPLADARAARAEISAASAAARAAALAATSDDDIDLDDLDD